MEPSSSVRLVDAEGNRFFGPGPFELLIRVRHTQSLHAAAKEMGMAYSKAVRLVAAAEDGFGCKLLDRQVGGRRGGGSRLTPLGNELLDRYEAWQRESEQTTNRLFSACFAGMLGAKRLGCVVMASGQAKRFGRQKLMEPLLGVPVLERTLRAALDSAFDVVVPSQWEEVRELAGKLGAPTVEPAGPRQSDTIRAGMDALGERAGYLFLQGDQPLITAQSLDALAKAFSNAPTKVVRLSWQGRPASPVLFPGCLRDSLRSLEGDVGGSALLREHPELAKGAVLVEAQSGLELCDVDTPTQLEQLAELYQQVRSDAIQTSEKGEHDVGA